MRALRILLVLVVLLGGLFLAVDRAAVYFAESEAEDRVAMSADGAASTEISIKGFPFLTQVAASRLDRVDLELTGMETSAGGRAVRVSEVRAQLHDVKLGSGYRTATAARATGTALVTYKDLTAAASDGVVVEYGGKGKAKVTGTVEILGRPISRSVLSTVTRVDGHNPPPTGPTAPLAAPAHAPIRIVRRPRPVRRYGEGSPEPRSGRKPPRARSRLASRMIPSHHPTRR
ncbi:DUF2993 domain-containing protein [Streptomyces sp. NRRL F-3218]|uniref:LmeA family phospholipid-binding protein n=1 Tax=Streptomyces sp. NRRL F-3218 TaxID=1463847 RepID=UPI000B0D166F|nr:DUF2993 domain-containing protein [Streptomyces sp. NRRL F-3218]